MKSLAMILLITTIPLHVFAQTVERTMRHDGINRQYSIYVPTNNTPDQNWPLLLNMHATTQNRIEQQTFSNMSDVAEREGFFSRRIPRRSQ